MISESKITVRYAETDKMGVVYHSNYLVWFEIGRTEFLSAIGQPYTKFEERHLMSPVLHAELDYSTPLHYGEIALVRTRLVELTSVKSTFYYEVYREGQDIDREKPCCTGRTTHCLVTEDEFKPVSTKRFAPDLYEAYCQVLNPLP